MPMHDWTRVEAGIYHAMHSGWIQKIHRALVEILPSEYYCLPEQSAGFGPDASALERREADRPGTAGATTLTRPNTRVIVESPTDFYLRKRNSVVIRHVSGDRIVAMIELLSPGNKSSAHALRQFVDKATQLFQQKIHLLIIDPFPPGKRDPHGIHAAIFEQFEDDPYRLPSDKPLTLVSYECEAAVRGYIEPGRGDSIGKQKILSRTPFRLRFVQSNTSRDPLSP